MMMCWGTSQPASRRREQGRAKAETEPSIKFHCKSGPNVMIKYLPFEIPVVSFTFAKIFTNNIHINTQKGSLGQRLNYLRAHVIFRKVKARSLSQGLFASRILIGKLFSSLPELFAKAKGINVPPGTRSLLSAGAAAYLCSGFITAAHPCDHLRLTGWLAGSSSSYASIAPAEVTIWVGPFFGGVVLGWLAGLFLLGLF